VPTAAFHVCATVDETMAAVRVLGLPVAIKADGLAAGKGVRIAYDFEDARAFAWQALCDGVLGEAGRRLVVESFLDGEEASLFVVTDGERWHALPPARDYKRLGTGDVGPNTGGMGAYAPAPMDDDERRAIAARIIEPTLRALAADGAPFSGLLYCGLMRTAAGPQVLEFNCRFGDPETQALLPLWRSDVAETLQGAASGSLGGAPEFDAGACVSVVLASPGYPDAPVGGGRIEGIERAAARPGVQVFHAATRLEAGALVAGAGRVLAVSGVGAARAEARARAYEALADIRLEGGQWRNDVGAEGGAAAAVSGGAAGAGKRS
jgi:phosphoribosylamine--glycine ligase